MSTTKKGPAGALSADKAPEQRNITIRKEIQSLLNEGEYSVSELSKLVRKSEKDVCDHLEHLLRSGSALVHPARCLKCDFQFEDRHKAKKPGKCPKCKSTHIEAPTFVAAESD
ncbi:transcriptional regulator [Hahella sp. CCB-MM4]|uniref:ArsR family transcriptional regulator n=1 Tax=Hahella sp. (strain CCB-MM4) TaxID=1926491 RepID=UPI000B9AC9C2|nr:ArsR family transcriptional regulator [Hahella sp. CCB-MM4]OZG75011.1 transcriptional regulator [Hahella sp. CCB-MM4]